MPTSFRIKDALERFGVADPLSVNDDGASAFECLRLLSGTVDLEDKVNGKLLKLRQCYLTEATRRMKANTLKELIESAFDGSVSLEDVSIYLKKTRRVNSSFWDNLKGELCLALASDFRRDHLSSFLHIYRMLEMSSVSLPLFYASAEQDYRKGLDFLKGLLQSPRDGDLAILKKCSETLAHEGGYSELTVNIYYSKGDYRWDHRFVDQMQSCVIGPENLKASIDEPSRKIDIPFSEFPSFVITFRNRLFHNSLSAQNINLDLLGGAHLACEPIIRPALNWFTLAICVILKQSVARYL